MPSWNELFRDEKFVARFPQTEVLKFCTCLESVFSERPLRIWDLCCGAGRHTLAVASRGQKVFASDGAPRGVERTRRLLQENGLTAELAVADMTQCPWPSVRFHGTISWDALHHNRSAEIARAISTIRGQLLPQGLFLATFKSVKADSFGMGREIEPGTYVRDDDVEAGVPHHFFTEVELRALLEDWEILVLAEQIVAYKVRGDDFFGINPFAYTAWGVLARKPA